VTGWDRVASTVHWAACRSRLPAIALGLIIARVGGLTARRASWLAYGLDSSGRRPANVPVPGLVERLPSSLGVHCSVQTASVVPSASSDSAFRCFTQHGRSTNDLSQRRKDVQSVWNAIRLGPWRRPRSPLAWSNVGGMPRMLNWTAAVAVAGVSFVHRSIPLISISCTTGINLRSCVYDTSIPSTALFRPPIKCEFSK